MEDDVIVATPLDEQLPEEYETPRVESVLTAEDLTREIQYAGGISSDT